MHAQAGKRLKPKRILHVRLYPYAICHMHVCWIIHTINNRRTANAPQSQSPLRQGQPPPRSIPPQLAAESDQAGPLGQLDVAPAHNDPHPPNGPPRRRRPPLLLPERGRE